jgi:DNA-binding SARP family transcriptional activator/Tfp pilus assembly protein PilF
MVQFRLLGSLEVMTQGNLVPLNSNRLRVVLAMLLFHEGRVVSLERIIDALWDDDPPLTAKGQVQTCISTLRQQFAFLGGTGLISTNSVGYTIRVPAGSLDIAVFESLVSRAREQVEVGAESAAAEFRSALALWRGPAAADVRSELVQTMATRLNEDRLAVLEECIQLELALGRHRELVGELSELTKAYPLHESLRAQHMLALYRSARQAAALESFQEGRRILREELGVEPSERLRTLQERILNSDPSLELRSDIDLDAGPALSGARAESAATVPRQLPAAIADFTGRQEMLADLIALLATPDEPDGRRFLPVASLNGKGGVGKTALALHVAHAVRHLYPDGQLFIQLHDADGQPLTPMELIAALLRSLGLPPMALPDQMAERTAIYRSWLGDKRVLIVLDDAHSVSQVTALIPGSPNCGVIITSQNPLASLPGAAHFEIGELDEAECVELLARLIGPERIAAAPAAAPTLVRLCGCLPLALRIVAAKLAARRHWSIGQMILRLTDESRRLDELALSGFGIRTTLSTSYDGLSSAAQRLFLRLSLLGTTDFAPWVSAPLLDRDLDAAIDVLEELVEARLLEVRMREDGSSRFRLHDLVRIYALERLAADEQPTARADALQRLLACWLSLASEAHRRAYGGNYWLLHGQAVKWSLPEDHRDLLLASPLRWFRAERAGLVLAITQAAQAGLDELCWDLAGTAVTLFESEYLVEDWQKTHELALDATRGAGNTRGEAAVLFSIGTLALNGRLGDAVRHLEPALRIFSELGDLHGRALALGGLAIADRLSGRGPEALVRYGQALAGYRAVGDLVGEVNALANMAQIEMHAENYPVAQRLLDQARELSRSLSAPRIAAQTEIRLADLYVRTGNLDQAEQSYRSVLAAVREEGEIVGEAYALAGLGEVRIRQGRYDLAEADLATALRLSTHMPSNLVHGPVLLNLAMLHLARRELERATPFISDALVIFSETGPAPVWRARFLELQAQIDELTGNPTAATSARQQALGLVGGADAALSRRLSAAIGDSSSTSMAGAASPTAARQG